MNLFTTDLASGLSLIAGKEFSGVSAIFFEFAENRATPSVLVYLESEALLISGPISFRNLCGLEIPMVTVDKGSFSLLKTGQHTTLNTYKG